VGPVADPARPGGPGTRSKSELRTRSIRDPGRDRCLPRASSNGGRHRLGEDCGVVWATGPDHTFSGHRVEPGSGGKHGARSGRGVGVGGRLAKRSSFEKLSSAAQRKRRSAEEAWTAAGGACRVRARSRYDTECARAGVAPAACAGVCQRQSRKVSACIVRRCRVLDAPHGITCVMRTGPFRFLPPCATISIY
jgi:hypothetical protein